MNTFEEELQSEHPSSPKGNLEFDYQTSYFVTFPSQFKRWSIRNVTMSVEDQEQVIDELNRRRTDYVDNYKTEDRDPAYIYKHDIAGLMMETYNIGQAFEVFAFGEPDRGVSTNDEEEQERIFTIDNYTNGYPPNDEVELIVHELLLNDCPILVFCQQVRTSLAKVSFKFIQDGSLIDVDKSGMYKINNNISFVLTAHNYFIANMGFFEKLFSFENQIALKRQRALQSLETSGVIEGYAEIENTLRKGYMARSLSMITLQNHELKAFLVANQAKINQYCQTYRVGAAFDASTNKLIVTDKQIAPLFITYLFSERVAENIIGELVYYKTFDRLNRT